MSHATDEILQTLRGARARSGLSQRDLSARTGVPQSHLSRIESGATDLRLSSLVELARALDYELVLVPRKLLPVVEALASDASAMPSDETGQRRKVLNRAQTAVAKLDQTHPGLSEKSRLAQTLRELANHPLGAGDLEQLRQAIAHLERRRGEDGATAAIVQVAGQLRQLRNRIAHALPEAPRPAYALDEEDDDA